MSQVNIMNIISPMTVVCASSLMATMTCNCFYLSGVIWIIGQQDKLAAPLILMDTMRVCS